MSYVKQDFGETLCLKKSLRVVPVIVIDQVLHPTLRIRNIWNAVKKMDNVSVFQMWKDFSARNARLVIYS